MARCCVWVCASFDLGCTDRMVGPVAGFDGASASLIMHNKYEECPEDFERLFAGLASIVLFEQTVKAARGFVFVGDGALALRLLPRFEAQVDTGSNAMPANVGHCESVVRRQI